MNRKQFGYRGEDIAEKYLRAKGFNVMERNFRCRMGEIDIIAERSKEIYFIEVKTRKNTEFGHPFESITLRKQRQIYKIAQYFLLKNRKYATSVCHFSAIGMILNDIKPAEISFLPDAFFV